MRDNRLVLAAALLVGLTAALGGAGCSDAGSRRAGQDILDEVGKAQEVVDRVLGILGGAAFVDGNALAAADGQPLPGASIDPAARKALDDAAASLARVLEACSNAGAAERAVGGRMLGRILVLKGRCGSARVAGMLAEIRDSLGAAEQTLLLMQSRVVAIGYLEAKGKSADEKLIAAASRDREEVARLGHEIEKKLPATLSSLQQERGSLIQAADRLRAEAIELRDQSRLAKSPRNMELFEQALKKEQDANKGTSKVADIEHRIGVLAAEIDALKLKRAGAEKQLAAVQAILDSRRDIQGRENKLRGNFLSDVDRYSGEIGKLAETIVADSGELSGLFDEASNSYRSAARRFAAAAGLESTRPELVSAEANALVMLAGLEMRSLRAQLRITDYAKSFERLHRATGSAQAVPPAVAKLQSCITAVDAARQRAGKNLQDAVQRYHQAIRRSPAKARWVLEGQLAAAQYTQYQLTGDESFRAEAQKTVAGALKGREESPSAASLVALRDILASPADVGDGS